MCTRHNGVHFFDIATSKSGPYIWCFVHFDLEMCFAPQGRALFRHRNFQKWSVHMVFCTFWLGNVLRATRACTFSTSQLPKCSETISFWHFWLENVLRNFQKWSEREVCLAFLLPNSLSATTACNFSSLIWPHSSAPAALASLLSTLRSHRSLEKHSESRVSYLFAHLPLLSYSFSSLIFSLLLFSSLTLPTSAFPTVHVVGRWYMLALPRSRWKAFVEFFWLHSWRYGDGWCCPRFDAVE